jgi:hypothetical protein
MMLHEIVVTQSVDSTQHALVEGGTYSAVGASANSRLSFVVFIKNVCLEEFSEASIL